MRCYSCLISLLFWSICCCPLKVPNFPAEESRMLWILQAGRTPISCNSAQAAYWLRKKLDQCSSFSPSQPLYSPSSGKNVKKDIKVCPERVPAWRHAGQFLRESLSLPWSMCQQLYFFDNPPILVRADMGYLAHPHQRLTGVSLCFKDIFEQLANVIPILEVKLVVVADLALSVCCHLALDQVEPL